MRMSFGLVFALGAVSALGCSKSEPAPTVTGASAEPSTATAAGGATAAGTDAPTVVIDELAADATTAVAGPAAPPDAAPAPPAPKPDRVTKRSDDVLMSDMDAKKFADMLTTDDSPTKGGMSDMSKRRPDSDLSNRIDSVKGEGNVAIGGGAGRSTGGGPKVGTGMGGGSADGAKDSSPNGRITIANKQTTRDSSLTVDVVIRKVQAAYFAGLRQCYKQLLVDNPTARGKLDVSFTVTETGRVAGAQVKSFDAKLDTCVASRVASWRFPIPKDDSDNPSQAGFAFTFGLVPD